VQRRSSTTAALVGAVVVVVAGSLVLHRLAASGSAPTTTIAATTSTTDRPTTTTTVAPGTLPQTHVLPPASTPGLDVRMTELLHAIATDDPALGDRAFFPLAAYLQTKSGFGNEVDWRVRLLGHFAQDVATYHRTLGPHAGTARLVSYAVDDAQAVWVLPGMEENKGPYWRVYFTTLNYAIGARRGSITVNTMISWRGEWYVVHLIGFDS